MIEQVYILQESATRDGLNFDYFCRDKTSLKQLATESFYEYLDLKPEEIIIRSVKFNDIGDIEIEYFDQDMNEIYKFKKFSYIKIPLR